MQLRSLVLVCAIMGFSSFSYATHICELAQFREFNASTNSTGQKLCKKEVDEDFGESWVPTTAFEAYRNLNNLDESAVEEGGFGCFRDACREELYSRFSLALAGAGVIDEKAPIIGHSKSLGNIETKIEDYKKLIDDTANNLPKKSQYDEYMQVLNKMSTTDCAEPDFAKCLDDGLAKIKADRLKVENAKKSILMLNKASVDIEKSIDNSLADIDKAYGGKGHKFHKDALKKLKAGGFNEKELGTPPSIKNACFVEAKKGKDKNPGQGHTKKMAACKSVMSEKNIVLATREKLKEFKDDIEGMNNEDLLALDLKTKIADLDLSEEEKKLADKLLPGIADKAAAKNLEGSIIGRMMDQMRADMCKVSQYPKLMCPNTDEGISKLINDSTGIAKETFLENSKKVKAKVQQEK